MKSNEQKNGEVRQRNSVRTREALLNAARNAFSIYGYEGASTRDIAREAGVNVALINRYFGSKLDLFREVVTQCIDLSELEGVSVEDLPIRLTALALNKNNPEQRFNPVWIAVHSSSSPEAKEIVVEKLANPMVNLLATFMEHEDAHLRSAIVLSVIAGIDVSRYMISPDVLVNADDAVLRVHIERIFRAVLT